MRSRDGMIGEVAAMLRESLESHDHDALFDEMSEKATAGALRVAPSTLSRWYWEGTGPDGFRPARILHGRRWYRTRDVAALLVDGETEAAD
ncbi:hypothetical protein [Paraburkholderia sp. JPY419]|uniref:hypothetical protein n=1 Tax=Paraburkholderia sp. JPY419 TaxID=667660 RepID=UPI003D263331